MTDKSQLLEQAMKKFDSWISGDFLSPEEKEKLLEMKAQNQNDLIESFYTDLEFGTGGIRSILGLGTNRMNRHSIRRATHAFALALREKFNQDISVAIGFDSRNFSLEFSKEAAIVLAAHDIKVNLFDHIVATPILSFAVRYHKSQGGIMITASHNPREYNGYKVYWDDGCQVTPPHDSLIIKKYQEIHDYSEIKTGDYENFIKSGMIQIIDEECENKYFQIIKDKCFEKELCETKGPDLSIIYTPLHGVGGKSIPRALESLGFKGLHLVQSQIMPDGNFPTVSPPNPEEPAALKEAINLMEEVNGDLVMATDPDADRLGVVIPFEGKNHILNGNQIGLLLFNYIVTQKKKNNSLGKNPLLIKTIVTSPLQQVVAEKNGVKVLNTLTGFKWICGKMREIEDRKEELNVLFSTEESFGYLSHTNVRDKDAVDACSLMAEMALFYKSKGKNLIEVLRDLYEEYGFSKETLIAKNYLGIEGKTKISNIVDHFRNWEKSSLGTLSIVSKTDVKAGKKTLLNGDSEPIDLPSSNVIGFELDKNCFVWLRPSGTEPKIKFYLMIQAKGSNLKESEEMAEKITQELTREIEEVCEKL